MRYVAIFDIDDEFDDWPLTGKEITEVATKEDVYPVKNAIIQPIPQRQVCNYYGFNKFHDGHARGWNDLLDILEGKRLGEYTDNQHNNTDIQCETISADTMVESDETGSE